MLGRNINGVIKAQVHLTNNQRCILAPEWGDALKHGESFLEIIPESAKTKTTSPLTPLQMRGGSEDCIYSLIKLFVITSSAV